jgi:hypothetical protein
MNLTNRHIDLDRRFRDLSDQEREDPNLLALAGESPLYRGETWDDLLKSERIVLLAEAGAGKTREMQAQQKRLAAKGQDAFFIPVEALDREDLRPYLAFGHGEAERFDAWLADPGRRAWFFLDAVDELKLSDGKLDNALGKLARAIGSARERAGVIVSCRPSDWRPVQDMEAFNKRLPVSSPKTEIAPISSDDAFMAPIKGRGNGSASSKGEKETAAPQFRCVIPQALDERQIEAFATARGVADPKALLAAIKRNEAWSFARRPLDLDGLIATWIGTGKLGTLRQQHECDVENSLKDDPDRPDHGVLSPEKATLGVERLALAMIRTKTRTIRAMEESQSPVTDSSSLDAASVLNDWTTAEVKTLLRRAIFDPATYGRVRFHHRSVQEFLAARRLATLSKAGLTKRQLRSLLFADTYGERVIIPTMRPIAAWLSQWDAEIAREVLRREPEVLILHGDAQTLSLDLRTSLIRAYVEAYADGGWRGLDMPIAEIQRLANPDLSPEIRRLWLLPHSNEEMRDFLLRLIWLGAIQDCADIALSALMDDGLGDYARIVGSRALGECERYDLLRTAADDLLANRARWPDRIVHSIISELYPQVISAAELETLIRETPEPTRTVGGISWTLYNLAGSIEPGTEASIALRATLAKLIAEGANPTADWYTRSNRYSYLTPALAALISRQLTSDAIPALEIISASGLAVHYHGDNTLGREQIKVLHDWFAARPNLRERTFWIEVDLFASIDSERSPDVRAFRMHDHSLVGPVVPTDWGWLLKRLGKVGGPHRDIAFALALRLWHARGRSDVDLEKLTKLTADNSAFSEQLSAINAPQAEAQRREWEKMEREHLRSRAIYEERQTKADASWIEWKRKADANPIAMVRGRARSRTMWTLLNWVGRLRDGSSHLGYDGWTEIRPILGDVIADGFEAALRTFWRTTTPPVMSQRKPDQQNAIFNSQHCALTGLKVEAASGPDWAAKLSAAQARRAAGWALTELNGMPEWFEALCGAQPRAVRSVLDTELQWELGRLAVLRHPHTLYAVRYQSSEVQKLAAPTLKAAALKWPRPLRQAEKADIQAANLESVLHVLAGAVAIDKELADHCEAQFLSRARSQESTFWLRALCAVDLSRGLGAFRRALARVPVAQREAQAVVWFGALFGDDFQRNSPVSVSNASAETLAELILLSYGYVRRENDIHHEGVYSPGPRDNAQDGRNRLLNTLFGLPGPAAHASIRSLADNILFSDMPDRLRLTARRRAADDSETSPISVADFRSWDSRFEVIPRNRDQLFDVMLDRIDDIEHDIRHHDFTDRNILEPIEYETAMQPLLAKKFADGARGQYQVVREDEVADKKETDIRLLSMGSPDRAVVELKIGDKWSITQLEDALKDQLVGQYLRHQTCSAGCLLVTYAGRKKFYDADRKPVKFEDVISHLSAKAAEIEAAENGRIRLAVAGLDLRAPAGLKLPAKPSPDKASKRSAIRS